jgi:radical SAM superfamily enzyme YgiQ (UPF0313 family)
MNLPPRIILATLNARFIHAALGLRYLLANMERHGSAKLRACTVLREYTITLPAAQVVADLLATLGPIHSEPPPIVGLGVYIWNVVQTTEVVRLLRAQRPDVRIVLGGPEVSHELDNQPIVALADHVITGWGDVSFPKLCQALMEGPRPLMKIIAGEQPALEQIALPYAEFSEQDLAHRVLYVEASRGCPFKCEFCLSALDKTAWAFEEALFLDALRTLYARGARTFKFVDRTFNLKIDASIRILEFFLQQLAAFPADGLFLHFEVVPDHLPERLKAAIRQFPPGVLQFEIGIQSMDVQVQQRISRKQDNATTQANLRWLLDHSHAHLHTDLIFGLPGESWATFAQGFDQLYAIGPHEIQLGVLKRLRGTPLARRSMPGAVPEHGMVYEPLPPYTVRQTDAVTEAEVQAFIRLARYWDLVANSGRFAQTLPLLMQGGTAPASAFAAFADLAHWLWHICPVTQGRTSGLTPENLVDALHDYLVHQRAMPAAQVLHTVAADYVASGARAKPTVLRAFLPSRIAPPRASRRSVAQRQQMHQQSAPELVSATPQT